MLACLLAAYAYACFQVLLKLDYDLDEFTNPQGLKFVTYLADPAAPGACKGSVEFVMFINCECKLLSARSVGGHFMGRSPQTHTLCLRVTDDCGSASCVNNYPSDGSSDSSNQQDLRYHGIMHSHTLPSLAPLTHSHLTMVWVWGDQSRRTVH